MDEYSSEKEQVEELKKLWKQHGAFILTGLILGVAVLGGWRYWKEYRLNRAAAASAQYEQLLEAVATNDTNGATSHYATLTGDFSSTPYVAQAGLAMAKVAVDAGRLDEAVTYLRDTIESGKDEYLVFVARLRLARVLLAQDKADEALQAVSVSEPMNFTARYAAVRGDVYSALGRVDEARDAYQLALDNFEPGLFDRQLVEMKLDKLGGAAAEPGA